MEGHCPLGGPVTVGLLTSSLGGCWLVLRLGLGTVAKDRVSACILQVCSHAREFYHSMKSRREVCGNAHASLSASQLRSSALPSVVPKAGL